MGESSDDSLSRRQVIVTAIAGATGLATLAAMSKTRVEPAPRTAMQQAQNHTNSSSPHPSRMPVVFVPGVAPKFRVAVPSPVFAGDVTTGVAVIVLIAMAMPKRVVAAAARSVIRFAVANVNVA